MTAAGYSIGRHDVATHDRGPAVRWPTAFGLLHPNEDVPAAGGDAEVSATADINPQDPATLRQGGNLRLALSGFPSNFNNLHIDGNLGEVNSMYKPTLPRAFFIAPDGETTVNTDYFTSVELTKTDPQVVTYTINPKAVWTDGTPITWEDLAAQIHATSGKDPAYQFAAPTAASASRR